MVAVIYKTGSLQVVGVCDGPGCRGSCPRMTSDGRVFCGGRDVLLSGDEHGARSDGLGRMRFTVAPMSICPLADLQPAYHQQYFSPFVPRGVRR